MTHQQVICLTALPVALIALVVGLLTLSIHPIVAVLLLLSAMGLSLRLVAGLCGGRRIVGVSRRREM